MLRYSVVILLCFFAKNIANGNVDCRKFPKFDKLCCRYPREVYDTMENCSKQFSLGEDEGLCQTNCILETMGVYANGTMNITEKPDNFLSWYNSTPELIPVIKNFYSHCVNHSIMEFENHIDEFDQHLLEIENKTECAASSVYMHGCLFHLKLIKCPTSLFEITDDCIYYQEYCKECLFPNSLIDHLDNAFKEE